MCGLSSLQTLNGGIQGRGDLDVSDEYQALYYPPAVFGSRMSQVQILPPRPVSSRWKEYPLIGKACEAMKKVNPAYVESVKELANGCPFFRHLSMSIVDMGIGYATVDLEVANSHLQAFGFVHGGVYSTVIDTAAFWAVFCELEEGTGITSVDLKVNYLAPVKTGRLVAEGRSIKLGKSLGLAEARVFDEKEKLVAHGSSTLIVIPGFSLVENPVLPPKFIA